MPRVIHIITTDAFAGVERYVCNVAAETAARGWEVVVVGGSPERMADEIGDGVDWRAGAHPVESLRSVLTLGRADVVHAHMTVGEVIAVLARPVHRAPIVSTRHFAARRGASHVGRLLAPWIGSRISREIAVSEFVARHLEDPSAAAVAINGVPGSPCVWRVESRVVLVMHRLEAEKDTHTALRAWKASGLREEGWSLRVLGDGSQRRELERFAESQALAGVEFAGWSTDVAHELRRAGLLLATAPAEPLGLAVLEAMAAGVPVVASASGGHLETVGTVAGAPLFPAHDVMAAASALQRLVCDDRRRELSTLGRTAVASHFGIKRHVDALLDQYAGLAGDEHKRRDMLLAEGAT